MKYTIFLASFLCIIQSAYSGSLNIADKARASASSSVSESLNVNNINDNVIAIKGIGNWLTNEKNSWVKLTWNTQQWVNKVVIYNYPSAEGRVQSGTLEFSDGSTMDVVLPEDGTAKAFTFLDKKTEFIKFYIHKTAGAQAGLSEIEVFPSPKQYEEPMEWVDPFIETNRGRFFLFTTGSRPYGMVCAAPMTKNWNNSGGGYAYSSNEILGFPQIHAWTLSGLNLMPTLASVDPTLGEQAWKSKFKHDDEIAQPGYHRVFLPQSNVWVEQTSTDRVSFYRFKWTEDTKAQVLLSLSGLLGNSRMTNGDVKKITDSEFEGSVSSVDRAYGVGPHDFKIYFVAQVDKEWESLDAWDDNQRFKNITRVRGDSLGTSMAYNVKAGDQLKLKIAISYTSIENARNNLKTECNTWDFNQIQEDSRVVWNTSLKKIDVDGGTVNQHIKFYTDLWHVLLGRHRINDVNGDYPDRTSGSKTTVGTWGGKVHDPIFRIKNPGLDINGNVKHNMYNSDAFWLTQWNLNVLWGLAWPEIQDDMAASMVAYSNNGGLLPRGPSGGGYSFIMTGCPSTNLLVSTYMKGIMTKADPENAFQQIKKNHLPGGIMGSSKEIEFYTKNNWWPHNAGINIETAFQDWGAAQMAKRLNKTEDYNFFIDRSKSWKNCFDEETKLLFPKDEGGNFVHKNPLSGAGFVEANAWQATWGVSHDIQGLSKLMGGDNVLIEKLNYAFEQEEENSFVHSYGSGHISYANQPGCSNAHVFSYANAPWLTQYWVRKVNEKAYGGITPDLGWGGHDEDQGQMGGVSALMSIGLFNIIGTESQKPYYEITAPVFDEVKITLDNNYYNGKEFIIKTYNNSSENYYIQKAKLNGKKLKNFWFYHEDFAKGGKLEIWLGNKPNKKWGLKDAPPIN
jgi:putative alpha-1,2-mannosidase